MLMSNEIAVSNVNSPYATLTANATLSPKRCLASTGRAYKGKRPYSECLLKISIFEKCCFTFGPVFVLSFIT